MHYIFPSVTQYIYLTAWLCMLFFHSIFCMAEWFIHHWNKESNNMWCKSKMNRSCKCTWTDRYSIFKTCFVGNESSFWSYLDVLYFFIEYHEFRRHISRSVTKWRKHVCVCLCFSDLQSHHGRGISRRLRTAGKTFTI